MTWLDPIGASLSLTSTFCFVNAKRLAWVVGMLAITVNTFLYFSKGLYGQVALEAVYMAFMFYGLILWSQGKDRSTALPITQIERGHALKLVTLNLIGISTGYWILSEYLSSTVPFLDAVIFCLSLTAQWLLCRKVIECWMVWFVVDAIVVWVHAQKGIPFHSVVHFIYLFLAGVGYWRWKHLCRSEERQILSEPELVPSA